MWVVDSLGDRHMYAYTLATGARDTSKEWTLPSENNNPTGIWSDGTTMWVVDHTDRQHVRLHTGDGSARHEQGVDTAFGECFPTGIWSDGTTMWVVDRTDRRMYAYTLATGARDTEQGVDTAFGE